MIQAMLNTHSFYYSHTYDITLSMQKVEQLPHRRPNFSHLPLYERVRIEYKQVMFCMSIHCCMECSSVVYTVMCTCSRLMLSLCGMDQSSGTCLLNQRYIHTYVHNIYTYTHVCMRTYTHTLTHIDTHLITEKQLLCF